MDKALILLYLDENCYQEIADVGGVTRRKVLISHNAFRESYPNFTHNIQSDLR
jgi:hypothetical protein